MRLGAQGDQEKKGVTSCTQSPLRAWVADTENREVTESPIPSQPALRLPAPTWS